MNFQHTEERRMLAQALGRFMSQQYTFDARDRIACSPPGFSKDVWKRFAELGAIGALFSEADGGLGGEGFDITVVFECLGRALVVEPFLDTLIVGQALSHAGNDSQKRLLETLIDGSCIASFAHEEPDSHYELSRVTSRATRDADGWTLAGTKAVVQNAEHADILLVSARTGGHDDPEDGISLFIVPRGTPGLAFRGYPTIDGGRAAEVILNGVRLPDSARLGAQGRGIDTLEHAIGHGLLALCAEAVGAMDVVESQTLEYLRTRKQFGVPIGSFQALQHRMVELALEIEQSRSAVINAAAALRADNTTRNRALSAAKYTIGRIGTLVAQEGIQLHGGIGMTHELPLSHFAKRLIMIDHQLGDQDHHLKRYMSRGE